MSDAKKNLKFHSEEVLREGNVARTWRIRRRAGNRDRKIWEDMGDIVPPFG